MVRLNIPIGLCELPEAPNTLARCRATVKHLGREMRLRYKGEESTDPGYNIRESLETGPEDAGETSRTTMLVHGPSQW